jgi:hypothetical protein
LAEADAASLAARADGYLCLSTPTDILSCKDGQVTFRHRDAKTCKAALRTLPGADFLWLVLQHALPKGLRRARNFGFLHPKSARAVRLLRVLHLRPTRPLTEPAAMPVRPAWRYACGQPMAVLRQRMLAQAEPDDPAVHDKPDKRSPMEGHATH